MSQLSEILHGDSSSGKNHSSLIARLGQWGQKFTDPLAWVFGRKYTDKLVDIADFSNKQFSSVMKPFDKVDQTINPFRRYNVVPGVNNIKDWVANKPADAAAIAAGAYFGGGALGNMFGGMGNGGGLGNTFGGGNSGLWDQAFSGSHGFSGAPYGSNPAAGISGIAGPIGGGGSGGGLGTAGLGTMDWIKLGSQAMGAMPQPAQQAQVQPMQRPPRQTPPPRRFMNGHQYVYIDGQWYEEKSGDAAATRY